MADARRREPPVGAELVPDNAPFDDEQRAWLNGFLVGLLGLSDRVESTDTEALPGGTETDAVERTLPIGGKARPPAEPNNSNGGRTVPEPAGGEARHMLGGVRTVEAQQGPPLGVVVRDAQKLRSSDAGTDISELTVDLGSEALGYQPGDSLAVVPTNDLDLVRDLLRAIGARGQEMLTTRSGTREAWRCLLEDVDVTHLTDETFVLFGAEARAPREAKALAELRDAGGADVDLLDVLQKFASSRPTIDQVVATLSPLRPRLYAVASSPPGQAKILVRALRIERFGRERRGVASMLLSEGLFQGDQLTAYVHVDGRFSMPEDTLLVFVACGIGLGRFNGLLEELARQGREGGTWLIVSGCFPGDEDIYEKELRAFRRSGVLEHLDVVPVTGRGRRVGPHEVMRKRGRRLAAWIAAGARIYVSGEARALNGPLAETLTEVLVRHGRMSTATVEATLAAMRREGRHVEELY